MLISDEGLYKYHLVYCLSMPYHDAGMWTSCQCEVSASDLW
jgi:hypothetical protein